MSTWAAIKAMFAKKIIKATDTDFEHRVEAEMAKIIKDPETTTKYDKISDVRRWATNTVHQQMLCERVAARAKV